MTKKDFGSQTLITCPVTAAGDARAASLLSLVSPLFLFPGVFI